MSQDKPSLSQAIAVVRENDATAVPDDLFHAIQHAFNLIPNKRLGLNDYPDTYALAAALGKLRR